MDLIGYSSADVKERTREDHLNEKAVCEASKRKRGKKKRKSERKNIKKIFIYNNKDE